MKLIGTAAALLTLNASLGQALKVHPEQEPGIYIGSHDDEHGLNHTRIGDIHAASRILRGRMPSTSKTERSLQERKPGFGETTQCYDGGALDEDAVATLVYQLGGICDHHGSNAWVKKKSTVYATDGQLASYFCDYGNDASWCTGDGLRDSRQKVIAECNGGPGEDYHRVHEGPNWSYGTTFSERHFCTMEGGHLTQQQGQIG